MVESGSSRLPRIHRQPPPSFIATPSLPVHISTMNCRHAEKALSRHLDGELPAEQVAHLEQHLASCAACRETAAIWQGYGDSLRAGQPSGIPDPTLAWHDIRRAIRTREDPAAKVQGRPWWAKPLPWAAATTTVALVAIGYLLQFSPETRLTGGGAVEYVDTDLPGASTIVYVDDESGWNIVWVVELGSDSGSRI
jgi:anti-sigma-K factor RskA